MNLHDNVSSQLFSVRDFVRWAVSQFTKGHVYYGHGTDNALDEAFQLVLHAAGIPLGSETLLLDAKLTQEEKDHVISLVEERVKLRIPVPYLTGIAWFAGLSFKVDERVLIPRSPLGELIENGFQPWVTENSLNRILDLCTGSGCIGIACAHYFGDSDIDLVDISPDALEVANDNIEEYELQGRVRTVESDLFDGLEGRRYGLIVSNPPYVDSDDLTSMPEEYHHEPALALSSGDDGLDITRRILKEAANFLTSDGILIVEVGNSCIALEEYFPQVPFTWIEFERGGHGVFVFTRDELELYQRAFI
ncbi:MAG: ribosomal protein L3 glutamine methyltransferase [Gammaproteobacteria bacterium]|jgi:ribosomal protein L3 glutamine methyltransferase